MTDGGRIKIFQNSQNVGIFLRYVTSKFPWPFKFSLLKYYKCYAGRILLKTLRLAN